MFDPINPFLASAKIYPSLILILAPSFFKANKCKSTGLVPIAHPPGNETFAFYTLSIAVLKLEHQLALF